MSFDRLDDLLDALYSEGRRELAFEELLEALRGLAGRSVLIQALGIWFHPPLLSARGELTAPRPAAEVVAAMPVGEFNLAEHPSILAETWSIRTKEHHGSYASLLLPKRNFDFAWTASPAPIVGPGGAKPQPVVVIGLRAPRQPERAHGRITIEVVDVPAVDFGTPRQG